MILLKHSQSDIALFTHVKLFIFSPRHISAKVVLL